MDQFMEEVVVKRNRTSQSIAYAMANVLMVVSGLYAFLNINLIMSMISQSGFNTEMIFTILITLLAAGCALLLFLRRDTIKMEYEYTFTNGIMDFAQVYNNKKRKNLGTMNLKNVEACGRVASGSFQRYITMPGIKRTNWFLNRDEELFYFYFTKDGHKRIIIIEPTESLVTYVKRSIGQGVFQTN
jgi:hypothetical protein